MPSSEKDFIKKCDKTKKKPRCCDKDVCAAALKMQGEDTDRSCSWHTALCRIGEDSLPEKCNCACRYGYAVDGTWEI